MIHRVDGTTRWYDWVIECYRAVEYRIRWGCEYIRLGFNPQDVWSLDATFGRWITPRLKLLKRKKHGVPCECFRESDYGKNGNDTKAGFKRAQKRWDKIMDEMIEGFTILGKNPASFRAEDQQKINRAFELLEEWHGSLWD